MQSNLIRRESTGKVPASSHTAIFYTVYGRKRVLNVCGAKRHHMLDAVRYFSYFAKKKKKRFMYQNARFLNMDNIFFRPSMSVSTFRRSQYP